MLKYKNLTTAFNTEKSLEISERGWHRRQEELRRGGGCACRRVGPRRGEGARADGSGRGEAEVCVQTGRRGESQRQDDQQERFLPW